MAMSQYYLTYASYPPLDHELFHFFSMLFSSHGAS